MSHQGLQEGFARVQFCHHILLPLGSLGVWAGGCCTFGFDHLMARAQV